MTMVLMEPQQETFPGFVLPQDIPKAKTVDITNLKLIDYVYKELVKVMDRIPNAAAVSANQLGLKYRIFVIDMDGKYVCFVNTDFQGFGDLYFNRECCLSIGLGREAYDIRRFPIIKISGYVYENGVVKRADKYFRKNYKFTGQIGACIQHECNHINENILISHVGRRLYN